MADDDPIYYPEKVFEEIPCTGPGQSYVRTERESVSGEYGQCESEPLSGSNEWKSSSRPLVHPPAGKKNAFGNNILGPLEGE